MRNRPRVDANIVEIGQGPLGELNTCFKMNSAADDVGGTW